MKSAYIDGQLVTVEARLPNGPEDSYLQLLADTEEEAIERLRLDPTLISQRKNDESEPDSDRSRRLERQIGFWGVMRVFVVTAKPWQIPSSRPSFEFTPS